MVNHGALSTSLRRSLDPRWSCRNRPALRLVTEIRSITLSRSHATIDLLWLAASKELSAVGIYFEVRDERREKESESDPRHLQHDFQHLAQRQNLKSRAQAIEGWPCYCGVTA